jgi:hypothetical protein
VLVVVPGTAKRPRADAICWRSALNAKSALNAASFDNCTEASAFRMYRGQQRRSGGPPSASLFVGVCEESVTKWAVGAGNNDALPCSHSHWIIWVPDPHFPTARYRRIASAFPSSSYLLSSDLPRSIRMYETGHFHHISCIFALLSVAQRVGYKTIPFLDLPDDGH